MFSKRKTIEQLRSEKLAEAEADLIKSHAEREYWVAMNKMMIIRVKRLKENQNGA